MIVGGRMWGGRRDPYFSSVSLLIAPAASDAAVTDTSSLGHSVTTAGGAALSTAVADPWGGGRKVVALNGTTQYLSVANHASLQMAGGDFTLEIWLRLTAFNTYNPLFSKYASGGPYEIYSDVRTAGADIQTTLYYSGASGYNVNCSPSLVSGQWAHLALVRASGQSQWHKNGSALGSPVSTPNALTETANALNMGAEPSDSRYMPGYVGAVRITKGIARPASAFMINEPPPRR